MYMHASACGWRHDVLGTACRGNRLPRIEHRSWGGLTRGGRRHRRWRRRPAACARPGRRACTGGQAAHACRPASALSCQRRQLPRCTANASSFFGPYAGPGRAERTCRRSPQSTGCPWSGRCRRPCPARRVWGTAGGSRGQLSGYTMQPGGGMHRGACRPTCSSLLSQRWALAKLRLPSASMPTDVTSEL